MAEADDQKPAVAVTFEGQIKPIIAKRCAKCHTGDRPRGDLDLSTLPGVLAGGITGKSVVAGKPESSLLFTMTAHIDEPKMPPGAPKIPQSEIDTIRKWIEGGLIEKVGTTTSPATTIAAPVDGLMAPAVLPRRSPVTAVAASPTAPIVAVSGKNQVLLYDLPVGKLRGGLAFPEGEVAALRFSRDGTVLLAAGGTGGQSGAVVGFDTTSWKRLFTINEMGDSILAADLSADRSRVVFGGPNRLVKIVAVVDGKVLHTLRKPTDWVLSVGFSPEGSLVAAGDRFGGLYVWETNSGKEFATLRGHTKGVTGLAWRADSNALATTSEDHTVRIWDLHSASQSTTWEAHNEGVLDIAWHPSGMLGTAGRDGRIRLWDATGKRTADFGPSDDAILKLAFSHDSRTVFAGDWSGRVRSWPVVGGVPSELALPIDAKPVASAAIPVPTPKVPVPTVTATKPAPAATSVTTATDLARKRAALKAIEDAVEQLKNEAARNPANPALAKAYLQVCEAALTMKAEVLAAEAAESGSRSPAK